MRLVALTHVPFEGPGAVADWAASRGHSLRTVECWREPLPGFDDFDGLVAMGGPMGVADAPSLAWMREEIALILRSHSGAKPVLGVCLGAQLLAHALGARVAPQGFREIGWHPVRRVGLDPWTARLPRELPVFHWHGDAFEVPGGAVRLFESEACETQGFRHGRSLGLQFHLEMRTNDVEAIVREGDPDLVGPDGEGGRWIMPAAEILAATPALAPPAVSALEDLLDAWAR